MGARNARGGGAAPLRVVRLAHADRREDLLDAASRLITTSGVEAVSMESVADAAGVSRPLVYKHFANRSEILVALFRRESQRVHNEISEEVSAAESLEETYRALIRASIRMSAEDGPLFAALRGGGAYNAQLLRERQARDRRTVRWFAERTLAEYDLPRAEAEAASSMMLCAMEAILLQYRTRRTAAHAAQLEEIFVDILLGGFDRLTERISSRTATASR